MRGHRLLRIARLLGRHRLVAHKAARPRATAVLVQPNLDVGGDNDWSGSRRVGSDTSPDFTHLAGEQCKTYIAGIPQTGAPNGEIICPPYPTHPDLVVWPEAPSPFFERDPRFQNAMVSDRAVRTRLR